LFSMDFEYWRCRWRCPSQRHALTSAVQSLCMRHESPWAVSRLMPWRQRSWIAQSWASKAQQCSRQMCWVWVQLSTLAVFSCQRRGMRLSDLPFNYFLMRCYGSHACHGLTLSALGQEMVISLVAESLPSKVQHIVRTLGG
jgi:hypothetical protein